MSKEYSRERYYWYKEHGICVQCGSEKAKPGHIYCSTCLKLHNIWNKERYQIISKEKKQKNNPQRKIYSQKLRDERRAKGLCGYCGGKLADDGHKMCPKCRAKMRNRYERTKKALGRQAREYMGICSSCNRPVVPGYKKCEVHLEITRNAARKASLAAMTKRRKDEIHKWLFPNQTGKKKAAAIKQRQEKILLNAKTL